MALRQARILSSETDNTIKQEQTTNVNIKLQQKPQTEYPTVPPSPYAGITPQTSMGFTQATPTAASAPLTPVTAANADLLRTDVSALASAPQTDRVLQSDLSLANARLSEAERQLADVQIRNEFLELLLEMYQSNPLKINSYVIADNKLFMRMVKLLCGADKVELVLDDDLSCGCCGTDSNLIYVSKILVTINDRTEDLKYCRNDVYSQFTRYNISTKIVSQ